MSRPYQIAPAGDRDIRDIHDFIARRSPQNAAKVVRRLYDEFQLIADMPGIGHTRPELHDDTLCVISVYKFLIIYDPKARPLAILRIIHGARDLKKAFFDN